MEPLIVVEEICEAVTVFEGREGLLCAVAMGLLLMFEDRPVSVF